MPIKIGSRVTPTCTRSGNHYSLVDIAFTPNLARLEHLNILRVLEDRAHLAAWYKRCKLGPSFEEAID
jgi:glutathione S-transferase